MDWVLWNEHSELPYYQQIRRFAIAMLNRLSIAKGKYYLATPNLHAILYVAS